MNAPALVRETPRPVRQVVEDVIPILDTARFEHMQRIATIMANASLVPETLRTYKDGDKTLALPFEAVMANCFLVVNQATRWGMDPFGVAQCLSIVKGKFCYEGKLVAAVLDAKLGVALRYEYNNGTGDALGVRVVGTVDGVEKDIEGTVGAWKTTGANSPWSSPQNHRRQLAYRGAREWARIHKPALMLGAYTDDEIDDLQEVARANRARDISPPPPPPEMPVPAIDQLPATRQTAPTPDAPAGGEIIDAQAEIDPDAIVATLADQLAVCTDETCIEEGYAYLDAEAELAGFEGYVEKARALKDEHLARVAKRQGPSADDMPPPPPADGDEVPPPPASKDFDLDGWRDIAAQQPYVGYAEALVDYAKSKRDMGIFETFWNDSQTLRAKLVPLKDRSALKDHLLNRWEKA